MVVMLLVTSYILASSTLIKYEGKNNNRQESDTLTFKKYIQNLKKFTQVHLNFCHFIIHIYMYIYNIYIYVN